jgi:two-component system, NtrC family, sensor kinase
MASLLPETKPPPRQMSSTGRRLFLAFATLVGAFVVGLLLASAELGRIAGALERIQRHEAAIQLSQSLESSVRDQYGHQAQIAAGDAARLADYLEAQRQVRDLEQRLRSATDGPEEALWLEDIELTTAELDRTLEEAIARALPAGERVGAPIVHDRAYSLVTRIEERIEQIFNRRSEVTAGLRETVTALQRNTQRWILAFLVAAPLFATAVGLYIRRSVARPVALLGQGAARLAGGDLDTRIDIHSRDEFGALASQFNAMTGSLKQNQERLLQSEKLASVGRLAAGLAHELNNPLSVMLGFLMLHRRRAEGELARHLWLVEQEAIRCQEIVQDLLEVSRPDSDLLRPGPVDLRELCDEVAGTLRSSGQIAVGELQVDGAATAVGERSKLRRVVVNLVKNAADAAGAQGRVRVEVSAAPGAARVAVSDTGPGITASARARIFEPFFTTKATGTGLGLAVSRAIARAHRGDIEVGRSTSGGALFTLRLPGAAERTV